MRFDPKVGSFDAEARAAILALPWPSGADPATAILELEKYAAIYHQKRAVDPKAAKAHWTKIEKAIDELAGLLHAPETGHSSEDPNLILFAIAALAGLKRRATAVKLSYEITISTSSG